MSSNIFATLCADDLPDDFRLIAEVAGIETARLLIQKLGGIRIYVPSHKRLGPALERYIRSKFSVGSDGRSNVLELAQELGVTPDFVRRVARPPRPSARH